ncbi:MAG: M28 family peptidase [Anaerolineales bacterium]|nr:M28 family peptidase [Anaerolineales bacterium]MBK9781499.1 M28 family peptidase [Anaerolineales bacterium]
MMNKRAVVLYLTLISGLLLIVAGWYTASFLTFGAGTESAGETAAVNFTTATAGVTAQPESFDGARAYIDVQTQVDMGPRTPGSEGHAQVREWMREELESAGWTVEFHESERLGHPIYNLIAKRSSEQPQIIFAAHYDTRFAADNDPDESKRTQPVPGANDGASGVAVLLELARTLPESTIPVWLVFFDTEDNGRIEGWDWILGSRAFVEEISIQPQAVVIVDMIGDADLNLYYEKNSDKTIRAEIWETAARLGYGNVFIQTEKHSMLDDHTPFLEKGIPAVDIIDFDYPYWHTTADTPDKVSPESLQAVGDTLWHWAASRTGE